MAWVLVRTSPDGRSETIPIEGRVVLGREGADVAVEGDRFVSGRHAEVEALGDQVVLRDLGSRNGTYLRLDRPIELRHGDVIAVGRQLLRYLE